MTKNPNKKGQFKEYKDDFSYCERVIKKHSKSFYAAFSTLPKEEAMSVYAVYAFCRKADDLVDEDADAEGLAELRHQLQLFEQREEVDHPVWRALRVVFDTFDMDIDPFYDMITGQEKDLSFQQPNTQAELEEYSYYVAGTVGLMLLPLLTPNPQDLREEALALGTAMQITNILRDVGEDLDNDRVYLPKEVMKKHGYTQSMLENKELNQSFIDLWEYEANEAEKYYEQAMHLIKKVNKEAKKPLLLSLLFYKEILEAVRLNNYDCFTQRSVVGKRRKLQLLMQSEDFLK